MDQLRQRLQNRSMLLPCRSRPCQLRRLKQKEALLQALAWQRLRQLHLCQRRCMRHLLRRPRHLLPRSLLPERNQGNNSWSIGRIVLHFQELRQAEISQDMECTVVVIQILLMAR